MAAANIDPGGPGSHPPLTRSDAWLLAAIADGSHDGRPVTLRDFVNDADWLNRAIPTFDEVSFGLPRLIAAGYVTVAFDDAGALMFRANAKAINVRGSIEADALGGVLFAMNEAVGTAPYPEPEREDRSLGRLPSLTREEFDAAVRGNSEEMDRLSKPLLDAARALMRRRNRGS